MSGAGTIARAGLIVSSAFLVSRILGYVRLVVIGDVFGSSAELDAFFAAFRLPDLIFQLVAAGALSSALVPIVTGLFTKGEEARAWRVVSTVINLMLIGLAVLADRPVHPRPGHRPDHHPGLRTGGAGPDGRADPDHAHEPDLPGSRAVATSVLNAGGRFAASAIAPIVYNIAIILAAPLLGPRFGVEGLAVGVVVGSLSHLLVQIRPLSRLGFRYEPHIDAKDPQARRALTLMAPRAIGLGSPRSRSSSSRRWPRWSARARSRTSISRSRSCRSRSGSSASRSGSCSCRRSHATPPSAASSRSRTS